MILYSEERLPLELKSFPDGTFRLNVFCKKKEGGEPFPIIWQYENESELSALIFLTKHIKKLTSRPIELFMPYLPNARMDRVKHENEVFTLEHFCDVINWLGFDRVKVLDVHSAAGLKLLERSGNITPEAYIKRAMKESGFDPVNDCVFFPDKGSFDRYAGYDIFKSCGNLCYGIKNRDWETGVITSLEVTGADVKGRNVFIIDDICSYGGTVYHSALRLTGLACRSINVFFTHCENSVLNGKLLKSELVEKIYTTNSICTVKDERIVIFDCL
ncbi:MAG: ribose-phosphate pyrophosphokinase [Oscillospiraceae bacterium]|nr:ribose-phosphate pyrophosphokinase [Oscillospiraceae bacterium]